MPETLSGIAAEFVREASLREQQHDQAGALILYEQALAEAGLDSPAMPGFVCGRLAALYRRVGRYDDEVLLLERFAESQAHKDTRSRFDARLSKARAIAEKNRRSDSTALESVRAVRRSREHRLRRGQPDDVDSE